MQSKAEMKAWQHERMESRIPSRFGFTLIELMVAVVVLLVVIAATSRIFGTASQVTGLGQASASVLQEAAVIERRMREDIANLSTEGIFAIRQVAVRNDIHLDKGGGLLNPTLPENAIIRADQLLFFTNNLQQPQAARINEGGRTRGQGIATRMYYGHAFQLPNAPAYEPITLFKGNAWDVQGGGNPIVQSRGLVPWHRDAAASTIIQRTVHQTGGGNSTTNFQPVAGTSSVNATQPEARQWLLVRQPVILVDDDQQNKNTDAKTVYAGEITTERSIFLFNEQMNTVYGAAYGAAFPARQILNGRLDAAATQLGDVRRRIRFHSAAGQGNIASWLQQRDRISRQLIYYPRAERIPPSMHRVDEALTNHVIGSAVSSFIVEWTYEDGVGEAIGPDGTVYSGFYTNRFDDSLNRFTPMQPWFGLNPDWCADCPDRGVGFYSDNYGLQMQNYQRRANYWQADTILGFTTNTQLVSSIEEFPVPHNRLPGFGTGFGNAVQVYEAIFGYNANDPLDPATGQPWGADLADVRNSPNAYTPWPSAIRVTMVLHDPATKLENGREFQFVINLPKRSTSN